MKSTKLSDFLLYNSILSITLLSLNNKHIDIAVPKNIMYV